MHNPQITFSPFLVSNILGLTAMILACNAFASWHALPKYQVLLEHRVKQIARSEQEAMRCAELTFA